MNFLTHIEQQYTPNPISFDKAEEISFFLLIPVRLAFGSEVIDNNHREINLKARVIGVIATVVLFPLVLPLTIVGIIVNLFSKTHAQKIEQYKKSLEKIPSAEKKDPVKEALKEYEQEIEKLEFNPDAAESPEQAKLKQKFDALQGIYGKMKEYLDHWAAKNCSLDQFMGNQTMRAYRSMFAKALAE